MAVMLPLGLAQDKLREASRVFRHLRRRDPSATVSG